MECKRSPRARLVSTLNESLWQGWFPLWMTLMHEWLQSGLVISSNSFNLISFCNLLKFIHAPYFLASYILHDNLVLHCRASEGSAVFYKIWFHSSYYLISFKFQRIFQKLAKAVSELAKSFLILLYLCVSAIASILNNNYINNISFWH